MPRFLKSLIILMASSLVWTTSAFGLMAPPPPPRPIGIEQVVPPPPTASFPQPSPTRYRNPNTPAPTIKPSTPAFTQPVDGSRPYVVAAFAGESAQPPGFVPTNCAASSGFRKAVLCPDLIGDEDRTTRERMESGLERFRID